MAQSPAVTKIRIGRCPTNPVTQAWQVVVVAVTGTLYKVYLTTAAGASTRQVASFTLVAATAWANDTKYKPGDIVTNDTGKYYVCSATVTDGKSAVAPATGPSGTGVGPITDDQVTWYYGSATLAGAKNDAVMRGLRYAVSQFLGEAWQQSTVYVAGNFVTNDTGKYYRCTAGGTSAAAGGPTGAGAAPIVDGTCTWLYQSAGATAIPVTLVVAAVSGTLGALLLGLTVTVTTAWTSVEIDDPLLLSCAQTHAAPTSSGLATDLAAILDETTDWYGVLSLYNSSAYIKDVAAWVELNGRLYVPTSPDTTCATTAYAGATDVLHDLRTSTYLRTAGAFHPRESDFFAAAEMGLFFAIAPGGDNWRMKALSGVTSGWGNGRQYTAGQCTNLTDRYANFYYDLVAGSPLIGGNGKVAGNEYVDVVRGEDWWSANLTTNLVNLVVSVSKIPFTNAGVARVEAIIRAMNEEGITASLINPGSPPGIAAPTVTVPDAGEVSAADRAARQLTGVSTSWTLAGAINQVLVTAHILV